MLFISESCELQIRTEQKACKIQADTGKEGVHDTYTSTVKEQEMRNELQLSVPHRCALVYHVLMGYIFMNEKLD